MKLVMVNRGKLQVLPRFTMWLDMTSIQRTTTDELSFPITSLLSLCLDSDKLPSDWKISLVRPHYKGKGIKQNSHKYRPISILSPISKLFESLIASVMYEFCESNSIFSDSQFGFCRRLSCELALNTLVDGWKTSLDNGNSVIAAFLDLG